MKRGQNVLGTGISQRVTTAVLVCGLALAPAVGVADEAAADDAAVSLNAESEGEVILVAQATTKSDGEVSLNRSTYTYDGTAKRPGVTVSAPTGMTVSGVRVYYYNNVDASKRARVNVEYKIDGKAYEKDVYFTIEPADIESSDLKAIVEMDDQFYTGKELKPTPRVTVRLDGSRVTLRDSRDFTVTYRNNVDVGTATFTVTGRGNFTGSLRAHFEILPKVRRIAGPDRYETASRIVTESFPESDSSRWAVVASGANFADALVASTLAGIRDCPIILTAQNILSPQAKIQIDRLGVESVYLVGGTSAANSDVATALTAMGLSVTRIAGQTRMDTSVAAFTAARDVDAYSDAVIICSGQSFADALSISPWAYASGSPILLVNAAGKLTTAQVNAIKADKGITRLIVVGGPSSVSTDVEKQLGSTYAVTRLFGQNRYETSAMVGRWENGRGLGWSIPVFATGKSYPDALAGANLAAANDSVLLLVDHKNDATITALRENLAAVKGAYILGGTQSVSADLEDCIQSIIE